MKNLIVESFNDSILKYNTNIHFKYSLNELLYSCLNIKSKKENISLSEHHLYLQSLYNKLFVSTVSKGENVSRLYKDCLEYYSDGIYKDYETLFNSHRAFYELITAINNVNDEMVLKASEDCIESIAFLKDIDLLAHFYLEIEILFPVYNYFIQNNHKERALGILELISHKLNWFSKFSASEKQKSVCKKIVDIQDFVNNSIDSILYNSILKNDIEDIMHKLGILKVIDPELISPAIYLLSHSNHEDLSEYETNVRSFFSSFYRYPRLLQFLIIEQLKTFLTEELNIENIKPIIANYYKKVRIPVNELNYN